MTEVCDENNLRLPRQLQRSRDRIAMARRGKNLRRDNVRDARQAIAETQQVRPVRKSIHAGRKARVLKTGRLRFPTLTFQARL
jgi:hypothetical protein